MSDALDDAFSEGLLGKGRAPAVYDRKPSETDMDAAMGEFAADLSMRNALEKQARARVRKMQRPG